MRIAMRTRWGRSIVIVVALAGAAPARAVDCTASMDAVAAEVGGTCDCCHGFRRCVRDLVKADVVAGTMPRACRRQARRAGGGACRTIRQTGCRLHWFQVCDGPSVCSQAIRPAPPCSPTQLLGTACYSVGAYCDPANQGCVQLRCMFLPPQTCG
jgi:hypothetical protein